MSMNLAKEWAREMNRGAGVGRRLRYGPYVAGLNPSPRPFMRRKDSFSVLEKSKLFSWNHHEGELSETFYRGLEMSRDNPCGSHGFVKPNCGVESGRSVLDSRVNVSRKHCEKCSSSLL